MRSHAFVATSLIAMALAATFAVAACSTASMPAMHASSAPAKMAVPASSGPATLKKALNAGECAACGGKGMAPMVEGSVKTSNGAQVADVGIKNGYYSPNVFTAKAGVPTKVVFTGKATDCLASPTFKSLNKTVNIEKTGSGTIDLGALAPGTYEFGCSMGMVGGKIVVQ